MRRKKLVSSHIGSQFHPDSASQQSGLFPSRHTRHKIISQFHVPVFKIRMQKKVMAYSICHIEIQECARLTENVK